MGSAKSGRSVLTGSDAEDEDLDLIDLKKIKYNKRFNPLNYSTCPFSPEFHAASGEYLEHKSMFGDKIRNQTSKVHITNASKTFIRRLDHANFNLEKQEILVKDDFDIYLMYDCAMTDMVELEKQLLWVGTYYIKKNETNYDFSTASFPMVERFEILEDLLIWELKF